MSAPARHDVLELALDEYTLAWDHLGLGLRHWNLDPPGGTERSGAQHAMRTRQAWDGLRARGLTDGRDLLLRLDDALYALAGASAELNATIDFPQGRVRLVGAARRGSGIVAELYPEGLRLRFVRGNALPAAIVGILPDRPRGEGTAVSAPSELLATERGLTGVQVEQALLRGGVRATDARTFRAMIKGPKLAGGKFGAARHDQRGRRHRSEFIVTYFDTERGGYTIEQRRSPDRRPWVTVAPASKEDLAQRLGRLLDAVRI